VKKYEQIVLFFSELSWILISIIFFGCGNSEKDINFAKVIQNTKDKGWFFILVLDLRNIVEAA
jgi:hypothetical protein